MRWLARDHDLSFSPRHDNDGGRWWVVGVTDPGETS